MKQPQRLFNTRKKVPQMFENSVLLKKKCEHEIFSLFFCIFSNEGGCIIETFYLFLSVVSFYVKHLYNEKHTFCQLL
jgi:hypothetical protein